MSKNIGMVFAVVSVAAAIYAAIQFDWRWMATACVLAKVALFLGQPEDRPAP